MDCNFIAMLGYPEPLKTKDIQKIIDDAPYVEKILAAGNKKSYMAQIGYLERQGFNDCFPGKMSFLSGESYQRGLRDGTRRRFFCTSLSSFLIQLFFPIICYRNDTNTKPKIRYGYDEEIK